jgi:ketosteroid isomerase-like protein
MKNARVLFVAVCAIAATFLVSSFAARTRAQASAAQQQVLDMQKKFQDLTVAGDADGVAALMTDDAIFVHGNGAVQSKSEFVGAIRAGQMAFSMYDLKDPKVVTFNGGAIVSGLVDLAIKSPPGATAPPRLLHMRGSSVWLSTSSGWKLALDQDTTLAGPPAGTPPPPANH